MSATAQTVQGAQAAQAAAPYGAPELKKNLKAFTQKALIIAVILHFSIIGGVKLVNTILARRKPPREIVLAKFKVLAPPPSLSSAPPPPVAVAAPIAPPTVGVPVPVPDAEAPEEQTVATQEEISAFNPNASETGGTGDIVIAEPTAGDESPAFGEFVYYEEAPTLINMPAPLYPDLAREAGLEGTVKVQALIGKDGQVKDVKVVKSIQMLDDSAVQAVRRSSWKPALNNNKPVAVWVEVPVRFALN
jgi:periplasmic protein TonB